MKAALLLFGFACFPITIRAANCDCTHFPIKPEACVRVCQAAILRNASKQELTTKLKLSPDTADAVMETRDASKSTASYTKIPGKIPGATHSKVQIKLDAIDEDDLKDLAVKYKLTKVPENAKDKLIDSIMVAPKAAERK